MEDYILNITRRALDPQNIAAQKCFLCGETPSTGKGEHIFPKWLQRRFNLWDETLCLLNGTRIRYRDLTVPACESCNNTTLSRTEEIVSSISGDRIEDLPLGERFEIGRWMAKILVGILIKEHSLPFRRDKPELGAILPVEYAEELNLLHLLIQSWRKAIIFRSLHAPHPFTLYVYSISDSSDFSKFEFSTNVFGKSVCIRFGDVGIAFVGDGGLQHHASEGGPFGLSESRLHPAQFDEICVRVHYKSSLRSATHLYVHFEDAEVFHFEQARVIPYTSKKLLNGEEQVFRDWSYRDLAKTFEIYRVSGYEHLIDDAGEAVYTRLVDEEGNKLNLD